MPPTNILPSLLPVSSLKKKKKQLLTFDVVPFLKLKTSAMGVLAFVVPTEVLDLEVHVCPGSGDELGAAAA